MDSNNNDRSSWRSARRTCVTTGCERFCMPITGKSKTTKKKNLLTLHLEPFRWCKEYISHTGKFLCKMATTKTTITTWAMRPSVRPITASTTSGITRATSTSPSTTPMTMLTSTIAWCTPCVEPCTLSALFHTWCRLTPHWLKSWVFSHHSSMVIIMAHPLWLVSPFLLLPVPPCLFLLLPPLPSCTLSSTTRSVMESLCCSANKESEDAYDVSTSLTDEPKELDWYWTRETFSLCVRSFEESNSSSSTFSASTSRRGWTRFISGE